MNLLNESVKIDQALAPVSLVATSSTGNYFDMNDFRQALFILEAGVIAAGKTAVIQIMEATDTSGTGAQAITGATATVPTTATGATAFVEIDGFSLSSGFGFIAAKITTDDTIEVSSTLLRGQPRETIVQSVADSVVV